LSSPGLAEIAGSSAPIADRPRALRTGHGVDPVPSLAVTARIAHGASAGVALRADGSIQPLPGLAGDELLEPGGPVLMAATNALGAGEVHRSFLWPVGGPHAPSGHTRVTVLATTEGTPETILGTVVLSPAPDRRGLTPRELEVLGLVVDGCSNQEIARTLVVAPRTVAAHLEHILAKLGVRTRTGAAVKAQREGLFIPGPEDVTAPVAAPDAVRDQAADDPAPAVDG
jgi:DNA-binding CsgD family transcriptional regulator